ncbi:farnesyltransferase [Infundibulicybe gibba]|nr:farnesyltransferase [Infundibulicybe gibba]
MSTTPPAPLLYADRPEWADVEPVPQYDANPIAPIFYTPEYKDATDYFRGITRTGEKSARVLEITEDIIRMNPAHYTAWQYRYTTLLATSAPLDLEFRLMDALAVKFLKTYQVWHHRRLLLQRTPAARTPAEELQFVARSLDVDAKNYHTWSYRQWVLARFIGESDKAEEMWDKEREWVEGLLQDDARNNSAWHHRFFVVFSARGAAAPPDIVQRELRYTKHQISRIPNNPSAWNYLRGVCAHTHTPLSSLEPFVRAYTVPAYATEDTDDVGVVDLDAPLPGIGAELPARGAPREACELWRALADEHDIIRKRYWEHRIHAVGL